jgi:ABC-type transport system involved in multi-copper enzyme maturation permease subunit
MPIADRGYQPYDGVRLPTRRNHWVITAMEVRRIWASLLVKIVVILAVLWGLVQVLILLGYGYLVASQLEALPQAQASELAPQRLAQELAPVEVLDDINMQMAFLILISLAWGASAIASDIRSRALQFYFAKPITGRGYLMGKIIPVAIYGFCISVFPGVLDALIEATLLRTQGLFASRLALILPAVLYAALLSVSIAIISVSVSSLSRNRVLTLAYWASILFVPLAVAGIVDLATSGEFQWLYLASPLSMLRVLGQAIFRLETSGPIEWYHALTMIVALCAGGLWVAWRRLSHAEVIG